MSEPNVPPPADAPRPPGAAPSQRRSGPYFKDEDLDLMLGGERLELRSPTWRGWTLGLLTVAALCFAVPHIDYVIRNTKLSYSLFPFSPIFVVTILVALVTVLLAHARTSLGLTRQDMVLVYAMGMAVNAIPGAGLLSVWVATITGSQYYATPENNWAELITRRLPDAWTLHDPPANVDGPRPIEWFYSGLPPGHEMPWQAWLGPFLTWSVAFALLFMMMFTLCLLLRRQWSERERLPFPLAQLPEDLTAGLHGGRHTPFLKDPMAQIGIGLVLLLHLWNGLQDYNSRIPEIPLRPNIHPYMSEPPWRHLFPLYTKIFPSVIGFTFLLSLEVSFSLWFFFVVMKIAQFAVIQNGLGYDGYYFFGKGGHQGMFVDQGVGALIAMVLAGLFLARGELTGSLMEALGRKAPEPRQDDFSPRVLWVLLIGCVAGSVAWLGWFGVSILYALPCVILLGVVMIGFTRVFCEGGVFYTQLYEFPSQLVSTVATPAVMGSQNYFLLSVYDRVMVADSFRVLTMPNLMNALHLASRTGLRVRSMTLGLVAAIALAVPLGFVALMHTAYSTPGGLKDTDWAWRSYPNGEFKAHEAVLSKLESWDRRVETARRDGKEIPAAEVPDVARRDWGRLGWLGAGMAGMFTMMFLRTRFFWWPHPIGYVMWMGQWSLNNQWFSFLIGWCLKWVCLRYGGRRQYLNARRFFLGVIVGEALAAMIWIAIAYFAERQDGYRISID
ncbi:MAG: hypothetical protein KIS92_11185 [Planctomycetota bacterium]|nr:hypothetical protein [Planctomycetota bacterium]